VFLGLGVVFFVLVCVLLGLCGLVCLYVLFRWVGRSVVESCSFVVRVYDKVY
jgi:hypothetical protein